MNSRYFNRATSLIGFKEVAAERNEDIVAAMKAVGLDPRFLKQPEEKVPFDKLCALFDFCAKAWDLPDLGLRIARYHHLEVLGPVALVTKMEPDLRSALIAMTENLVVHTTATVVALGEIDGVAMLTIDAQPVPAGAGQYLMTSLGTAWNVMESVGNSPIELIEVSVRCPDRRMAKVAEAYFRCPVRFSAENNALYFPSAALDQLIERTDLAYHALIRRYLSTSRDEVSGRFSDEVSAEIARQMEFGQCSLESVSQKLRIEPRGLQRRLHVEDTTFRSLVDSWRKARALSLVTKTRLPLSDVALALGYSDQSIFSRAFQRWFGETALSFRSQDARREV